jgi:hypothetical protein
MISPVTTPPATVSLNLLASSRNCSSAGVRFAGWAAVAASRVPVPVVWQPASASDVATTKAVAVR